MDTKDFRIADAINLLRDDRKCDELGSKCHDSSSFLSLSGRQYPEVEEVQRPIDIPGRGGKERGGFMGRVVVGRGLY